MTAKNPYPIISGQVVKGRQIGRSIGFPTANILCQTPIKGVDLGVYAAYVHYQGRVLKAVANIGTAPTVALNGPYCVEVHLLDFSEDLYDTYIKIELVAFLRAEIRFPDLEKLQAQIQCDVQNARTYLTTLS